MSHPLIAFRQQGVAHLLANYLGSQNITATVKPTETGDEFVVLLADDNDALKARAITEEFIQQPNNPKYQQAAWQHGENVDLVPSRQFDMKGFINNALSVPLSLIHI